jgi:hypothetical protein
MAYRGAVFNGVGEGKRRLEAIKLGNSPQLYSQK